MCILGIWGVQIMFMGCDRDGVGEVCLLWIVSRDLKVSFCVVWPMCSVGITCSVEHDIMDRVHLVEWDESAWMSFCIAGIFVHCNVCLGVA